MKIGVLKEIKNHEYRVGLTPQGAKMCVDAGHEVLVETMSGMGVGFSDQEYKGIGAKIVSSDDIFDDAKLIIKVKEPLEVEYNKLKSGQILFTYLHLAPDRKLTEGLLKSDCVGIAYETITDDHGGLPLLRPMSEVAGRMSIQAGAHSLEKSSGGSGTLLPGAVGVPPGRVLVIGAGVVGLNAARVALGLGAQVTVMDVSADRLYQVDHDFGSRMMTKFSNKQTVIESLKDTDLLIGAVLLPGAAAPKVITRDMLSYMKPGSVLVDVAIDQGGMAETSEATTHDNPTFIVDQIVHYCVTNMPGAVAKTSTMALTNSTLPYIMTIANKGYRQAIEDDIHLKNGLNVHHGEVTCRAVADALGYQCREI
ncbi:MAG: alanine dehydrogenase [SAR324 cluster bacterium]|nr:alanine dehydrogenase [SAR324 cluster bacterium]